MQPTPPASTVRDAVIALLRSLGMTTVFGNPGSTELPMFRSFPADFQYVLGLQESVVLGLADGHAQATGRPALVNLHSSAGVGHAMGNLFTAFRNQTPLLVTAGQQARAILPFDPFLAAVQATELPRPYVKWAIEPARAEDLPLALARAVHIAMQPPRGPVFVSIPADDWDRPCAPLLPRQVSTALAPDPAAVAAFAAALDASRSPVLVVGAGVQRDGACDALLALAQAHQAPVWAAPMSARCGFPERHPLFAGHLPAMRERIVAALDGHDLVLVLGAPAFLYHVDGQGPHLPAGARLLQITDDPQQAASAAVGDALVASLQWALPALHAASQPPQRPPARVPPRAAAVPAPAPDGPLGTAWVLQQLDALRGPDDVVVEEAPGARGLMQRHLPMAPGGFFTMASGGLGWGLPAAIGMALARRQQDLPGRVIALVGDGSAMYAIQALFTAAQLALPVTVLVLNNRRYAALQDFAPQFGYAPGEQPAGTDLRGLDFVQLAQGQGVPAQRVASAAALAETCRAALRGSGPMLVELVVD